MPWFTSWCSQSAVHLCACDPWVSLQEPSWEWCRWRDRKVPRTASSLCRKPPWLLAAHEAGLKYLSVPERDDSSGGADKKMLPNPKWLMLCSGHRICRGRTEALRGLGATEPHTELRTRPRGQRPIWKCHQGHQRVLLNSGHEQRAISHPIFQGWSFLLSCLWEEVMKSEMIDTSWANLQTFLTALLRYHSYHPSHLCKAYLWIIF
jgi:hypothetical protein